MRTDELIVTPGKRYKVKAGAAASVAADCGALSNAVHQLPQETLVVCAEARSDGRGGRRVRISSPAGWVRADDLEPAAPPPSLMLDWEIFQERHQQLAPGDAYGLEFPFTLDMLRAFGAEFLTEAFRASGAMPADNRVTEIVALRPLDVQGASDNAFLTVAYEKPDPELATDLFVKLPSDSMGHKFALSAMSHGEVEIARLSRKGIVPVRMANYYYGDFSSATTNYILITEKIKFGVAPIEAAYRKGYDHEVPEAAEHYRALTKALARLVAAHKTGAMGYDLEEIFPFARAARNFRPLASPEIKIDRLIDFIGRIAPQLFVAEATDPAFLQQWRQDLLFGLDNKDAVIAFLHDDVDYTGLCHPNLNVDNAWYWREPSGELQVGLLDWGGAGQMSIGQALSGMLMMPEPHTYLPLVREMIALFVTEYEKNGGLALDVDELLFHYKASLFSTAIWIILDILTDMLFQFSEDDYASMKDRFDVRLQESGLCSGIVWIDNILRDWLDELTPGDVCRRIVAQNG